MSVEKAFFLIGKNEKSWRRIPGFEPGTSRTQSENYTPKPNPLVAQKEVLGVFNIKN
jgi:hypothetical protein